MELGRIFNRENGLFILCYNETICLTRQNEIGVTKGL
ncbi:MAG: hypothetical protein H6Q70_2870 [Firmicutes bacterium]|nr:hypothetical protein [Bacillota bacterium]